MCDCRLDLDLLTTYTHDTELQVITALSLISTLNKSQQHPLSLFQPAVSSPAVPWQQWRFFSFTSLGSIVTASLAELRPGRSSCREDNSTAWTAQTTNRSFSYVNSSTGMCSRHPATRYITPFIENPLPQQRTSFRDRYPATGLHARIIIIICGSCFNS
jgi:hypothetical protein